MATNIMCKVHSFTNAKANGQLLCSECGVWLDGKDIKYKCKFCKKDFITGNSNKKGHSCKVDWTKKKIVKVEF